MKQLRPLSCNGKWILGTNTPRPSGNKTPARGLSSLSPSISAGWSEQSEQSEQAKSFSSIPGPVRLPVIGTLLPYKLGLRKVEEYHHHVVELYKKYGPVVKEHFGSQIIVHTFDPKDIRTVYENDGKVPFVPPLQETSKFYRQGADIAPGLGNQNGDGWYKLRHAVQMMMLRPKEVSYYYPLQDGVAKRVVDKLADEIDSEGRVPDLNSFITRWIMESAGMCCFERSLGCFDGGAWEHLSRELVEANNSIFKLSAEFKFSLQLYKYFMTPKYKKLNDLENFFNGTSIDHITETIGHIKSLVSENKLREGDYNFITYLMSRNELSEKDVIAITLSLFTDGLSTTSPTMLGNLHCLALNPEVQEKLYQEVKQLIDPTQPITVKIINQFHYLKAFVKEVFRFYPIGESVQRLTQKDLVLGGYHVPAGTHIDLNQYLWLRNEKYFDEPNVLRPERWMRNLMAGKAVDPYVLNPFSIGTRMCAGRRFAEQDLYTGLCRLLLKYRIEATDYSPPQQEYSILLRPKSVPIRFIPRN